MRRARTVHRVQGVQRAGRVQRAHRVLVGLAVLGALTAGCGIRSTAVPVDAGAAPSRVGCVLPGEGKTADESGDANLPVRLYLACGSRVSPVERRMDVPGGADAERLPIARKLLTALQADPDAGEDSAGFTTAVPPQLRVDGPQGSDPQGALRLSTPLEELPPFALAQIVCTYADTATSGTDRSVVLGGPAHRTGPDEPLRRFECGTALRTRPEAAATAGTPL